MTKTIRFPSPSQSFHLGPVSWERLLSSVSVWKLLQRRTASGCGYTPGRNELNTPQKPWRRRGGVGLRKQTLSTFWRRFPLWGVGAVIC